MATPTDSSAVMGLQRILTDDGYREAGDDANHPILQRMVLITKLAVCILLKLRTYTE